MGTKQARFGPLYEDGEAQRVITIRLPAFIHQALKDEAKRLSLKLGEDVSMNRLCVEKLKEPL